MFKAVVFKIKNLLIKLLVFLLNKVIYILTLLFNSIFSPFFVMFKLQNSNKIYQYKILITINNISALTWSEKLKTIIFVILFLFFYKLTFVLFTLFLLVWIIIIIKDINTFLCVNKYIKMYRNLYIDQYFYKLKTYLKYREKKIFENNKKFNYNDSFFKDKLIYYFNNKKEIFNNTFKQNNINNDLYIKYISFMDLFNVKIKHTVTKVNTDLETNNDFIYSTKVSEDFKDIKKNFNWNSKEEILKNLEDIKNFSDKVCNELWYLQYPYSKKSNNDMYVDTDSISNQSVTIYLDSFIYNFLSAFTIVTIAYVIMYVLVRFLPKKISNIFNILSNITYGMEEHDTSKVHSLKIIIIFLFSFFYLNFIFSSYNFFSKNVFDHIIFFFIILSLLALLTPFILIFNFGLFWAVFVKGISKYKTSKTDQVMDITSIIAYILRYSLQLVRIVIVTIFYILLHEFFYNSFSKSLMVLTNSSWIFTNLIFLIRLTFETADVFLLLGIQILAYFIVLFWLFSFLFTSHISTNLEKYLKVIKEDKIDLYKESFDNVFKDKK